VPNVENPAQVLTPSNLLVRDPGLWWRQPIPWSCNWFPKYWYPRVVHYRGVPPGLPEDDRDVPEVRLGWLEHGHARRVQEATLADDLDSRLADAASPALILPLLRGNETIGLTGFTPDGTAQVQLPDEQPRIVVGYRNRQVNVAPVVHRVLISTLEMGVYVVWHGAWVPPTAFPGRAFSPKDTIATLLEGVTVDVDGSRISPLGAEG
jgi:hypothetical protein